MWNRRYVVALSVAIIVGVVLVVAYIRVQAMTGPVDHTTAATSSTSNVDSNACQVILKQALDALDNACDGLGRNKACYGHNNIKAIPANANSLKFDTVGDNVAIENIKSLTTSPMDTNRGTWGLSLLKLQANLPDTLPGQNVTFLVYGDTSIQNTSGDMQSFYFSTGLGEPSCKEAPGNGIVVRSPNHAEVSFNANGVQITIASTVVLKAAPNKSLTVKLVEGHAHVSTAEGDATLKPGESVAVALGGSNGLQATGAPSTPQAGTGNDNISGVVTVMDKIAIPDAPINAVVEGCITAIDKSSLVVDNTRVTFDDDNKAFSGLKVGDCIHVDGSADAQNGIRAGALSNRGKGNNGNGNGNGNGNDPRNNNGNVGGGSGPGQKPAKPTKVPKQVPPTQNDQNEPNNVQNNDQSNRDNSHDNAGRGKRDDHK